MIKTIILVVVFSISLILIYSAIRKEKYLFSILLVTIVILISYFTSTQNDDENKINKIALAYQNNKKIICEHINVTNDSFLYITGTSVFVGKKNSKYKDYAIPLKKCSIGK